MIPLPFCRACGLKVETHPTSWNGPVTIDPDPHPDGRYSFDPRTMKLTNVDRPRMYRLHRESCQKKGQAPRRAPFICEEAGCYLTQHHLHCFRCKATDHLVDACEEEIE